MARLGVVVLSMVVVLGACLYAARPAMAVHLSQLSKTLVVEAAPPEATEVVHVGVDTVTVKWSLNATAAAGGGGSYKTVEVQLCYAPESRKDRGWRKAEDDLHKDKSCQFKITKQPYAGAGTFGYLVPRDIPTASYFVRAFALDASGERVAYGQSAPSYFKVQGNTGIHASIEIAAGVFSAFSVGALAFFFVVENRRKNK